MKSMAKMLILLVGIFFGGAAILHASTIVDDRFISLETSLPYSEVSVLLQEASMRQGWNVNFVQPVDTGLRNRGLDVGVMRILMLEPGDASRWIEMGGVEVASLLPLRITVYQESPTSLSVSALRPSSIFGEHFSEALNEKILEWDRAIAEILQYVAEADLWDDS